jgi:hypothetical protein
MSSPTEAQVLAILEDVLSAALQRVWDRQAGTEATADALAGTPLASNGAAPAPAAPRRKTKVFVTPDLARRAYDQWNLLQEEPREKLRLVAEATGLSKSSVVRIVEGTHIYSPGPRRTEPLGIIGARRAPLSGAAQPAPEKSRRNLRREDIPTIKARLGTNPSGKEVLRTALDFNSTPETIRKVLRGTHAFCQPEAAS